MSVRELQVELGERGYPIHTGRNLSGRIVATIADLRESGRAVAVITDTVVEAAQAGFLAEAFGRIPVLAVPAGETSKRFEQLERCCDFLVEAGLDRHGVVFAFGGGVVGDLAGYAAACYQRGVAFYQVPTTLLAMVDSSVGGKTGINLKAGKNLVGAFHQPLGVFTDIDLLKTLPEREFRSGMAEVIKHGLLADLDLFEQLEALPVLTPQSAELDGIVERNCAIKAAVVKADETEKAATGGRALLNLGHTFGHAIEAVAGYGQYLHGEAIGTGLVLAGRLSERLGHIAPSDVARIERLVERYRLPTRLSPELDVSQLLAAMRRDKKARAGRMRFVLLETLGKAITVDLTDWSLVEKLLVAAVD